MRALALVLSLASALLPGVAIAGEPEVDPPESTPRISNGTEAQTCQWPTTVLVGSGLGVCTGTLIHPQLVVTAAHCSLPDVIRFGERDQEPERTVAVDHCARNPDYDSQLDNGVNGTDYAYCKLAEPVWDIPFTPPVYGCELEIIRPGEPAWIVGFGNDVGDTGVGRKRWLETTIQTFPSPEDTVVVGTAGAAACPGDSGGPAYVRYPDGSFHAFGIVSGGPPCGQGADVYSLIHVAAAWIEASSGLDITPCHDVDGTWNPTSACQGFAVDPLGSDVDWAQWCDAERLGPAATCGPAFDANPDDTPPTVAITDPASGSSFPGPMATLEVEVDATDEGNGIESVTLRLDDVDIAVDEHAPYTFADVTLPEGSFVLVAVAEDWNGNVAESEPVAIGVGREPGGCACATSSRGSGGWLGFGLLLLTLFTRLILRESDPRRLGRCAPRRQ